MKSRSIIAACLATALFATCSRAPSGPGKRPPEGAAAVNVAPDDPQALLARARVLAEKRWGAPPPGVRGDILPKNFVRGVEPATRARLSKFLAGWSLFHVRVFNARSVLAGRPEFTYAVALKGEEVVFVKSDADSAALLSAQGNGIPDPETAKELALAFVELRGYEIYEGRELMVSEIEGGWTVRCALVYDPFTRARRAYEFTITPHGAVEAKPGAHLGHIGGYD